MGWDGMQQYGWVGPVEVEDGRGRRVLVGFFWIFSVVS